MRDNKKSNRLSSMGMFFVLLVVVAGLAILFAMIKVQWIDGNMWREKAQKREREIRTEPARRGNIYSSDGNILATTIPVCDLYLDLGRIAKKNEDGTVVKDSKGNPIVESLIADSNFSNHLDEVCQLLHEAYPYKSASYYRQRIVEERAKDRPRRCFYVQRAVPYSYWMQICKLPGWSHIVVKTRDGKSVIREVRAHTYGNLAENTIGFSNGFGSNTYTGLEGYYDSTLRGQDGQFLCRRLTRGVWIPVDNGNKRFAIDSITVDSSMVRPVVNGKDIVASIDTRYQDIAESSLRNTMNRIGGTSGCAILMEIETGYVLACSSLSIDTATHTYREVHNRNVACSDRYEPGSTFKTIILTAMMNDPTIHIDTSERVRVGMKVYNVANGKIEDSHVIRDTASVKWVIAHSSNVGMCELGWKYFRNRRDVLRHNVEAIFPYKALNLDVRTGEVAGYVNNLNASYRDFLNFCYGYSTAVSAMQILTFYNAIGGGGRMVKPLFCKEIIDGTQRKPVKPVVLNEHICSPKTVAIIKDLLVEVVQTGTGKGILSSDYGIAGKTGTAVHSYGNLKVYNASFAGFFPAEHPKYSCLVVVQGTPQFGSSVAPVFRDIADCVMATDRSLGNLRLEYKIKNSNNGDVPHWPKVIKGNQKEIMRAYNRLHLRYHTKDSSSHWAIYTPINNGQSICTGYEGYQPPANNLIPDCTGMTIKDAMALLNSMGIKVKFSGCGKVVRQDPRGHSPYAKGATVFLALGT